MKPVFKLSKLLLCIISGICFSGTVRADLYFAPELIADNPGMVADLSHFENSGSQLPGGVSRGYLSQRKTAHQSDSPLC